MDLIYFRYPINLTPVILIFLCHLWQDYNSGWLLLWDHTRFLFCLPFCPYDILFQNSQAQKMSKFSTFYRTYYHDYIIKLPLHLGNLDSLLIYEWTTFPKSETSISVCWPDFKTLGSIVNCHVVFFLGALRSLFDDKRIP